MYVYRSTVWKSVFLLHPLQERKYYQRWLLGSFWKLILSKKYQCVLVPWMPYGRSSRYHSFKQNQGLFHNLKPLSKMARSHTTRNRDVFDPICQQVLFHSVMLLILYNWLLRMFKPTISKIWQTRETINIITKFKRSKITPSHNHATLLVAKIFFRETEKMPNPLK